MHCLNRPCSRSCSLAPLCLQFDLFGDVAEAKEAAEFAGAYKEAKKCRAYETYQLLAATATFGSCIGGWAETKCPWPACLPAGIVLFSGALYSMVGRPM